MRAKEMRERTGEELNRMMTDSKSQLFRNRLKNATHQLEKTSEIRKARREIARISTVLNEQKISGSNLPQGAEGAKKDEE